MNRLRISFVTPTLNSERYFDATLSSIHGRVTESVEVQHIVVDGGSSDRTVQMASQFGCEIVEGEDEGLYDAMNIGIRRATGDVVAILNSDDTLLDGTLSVVADWFSRRKRGWMVGGLRWTDEAGIGWPICRLRRPGFAPKYSHRSAGIASITQPRS